MNTATRQTLTAETEINSPIEKVWELWANPEDILQWNNMSDEWHTTKAENDLRPGGKFLFVMALKDGSFSFDFTGTYHEVKINEKITYTLDDGRQTTIVFTPGVAVKLTETFEPVKTESFEMQQGFCQHVLNCFKEYAESK
jgi:uncharacterized protein YndB with AHSA1/START domain